MTVTGPDFVALQVQDLEAAAAFYESQLGLRRAAVSPPHAVVFDTTPAFAVRDPQPGVDVAAIRPHPGAGVVLWLAADDAQSLHDGHGGHRRGDRRRPVRRTLRAHLHLPRPRRVRDHGARPRLTRECYGFASARKIRVQVMSPVSPHLLPRSIRRTRGAPSGSHDGEGNHMFEIAIDSTTADRALAERIQARLREAGHRVTGVTASADVLVLLPGSWNSDRRRVAGGAAHPGDPARRRRVLRRHVAAAAPGITAAMGVGSTSIRLALDDRSVLDLVGDDRIVRVPAADWPVAVVAQSDVADAIAAVAADPERYDGRELLLTGPTAYGFADIADLLTAASGAWSAYYPQTPVEAAASRRHAGMSAAADRHRAGGLRCRPRRRHEPPDRRPRRAARAWSRPTCGKPCRRAGSRPRARCRPHDRGRRRARGRAGRRSIERAAEPVLRTECDAALVRAIELLGKRWNALILDVLRGGSARLRERAASGRADHRLDARGPAARAHRGGRGRAHGGRRATRRA